MSLLSLLGIVIALFIVMAVAVRAIGGNFLLVDDWRKAWKFYSTWSLAFLALLPDLWNSLAGAGFVGGYSDDIPPAFNWALKIGVMVAFLLRQVKQVKAPELPDFDGDGKPG
ncbi:MAG TPA: hypothetical protein PK861_01435 [Thermomonas sp.]|nr:hypothetical protein [Thermomonas sp.]